MKACSCELRRELPAHVAATKAAELLVSTCSSRGEKKTYPTRRVLGREKKEIMFVLVVRVGGDRGGTLFSVPYVLSLNPPLPKIYQQTDIVRNQIEIIQPIMCGIVHEVILPLVNFLQRGQAACPSLFYRPKELLRRAAPAIDWEDYRCLSPGRPTVRVGAPHTYSWERTSQYGSNAQCGR